MHFARFFAVLCFAAALGVVAFGLAACAGREAPAEPQVKVRGQYDISIGVRR